MNEKLSKIWQQMKIEKVVRLSIGKIVLELEIIEKT